MKKRRMVMLVDPSVTFDEIFRHGMLERGFAPMTVRTGAQAMTELARTPFDLICSTMHLPDMQGTALCATLRRDPRLAATPFFLFTADADRDAQRRVMPEGVTEVFHKNEIAELFNYIAHFPFDDQMLSGRVLLVEDEVAMAALLTRMLDSHGMQVTTCANADAAWPEFQASTYDLVVTDVVLTGQMTGPQLVRRIRRFSGPRGETPILAMTGFEDTARRLELFRAGINDYIAKPLLEQEFVVRVNNLLLAHRPTWATLMRDVGPRLREVRAELEQLLAHPLAEGPRQRVFSSAQRLEDLERQLAALPLGS